jgi:hypothetical protein
LNHSNTSSTKKKEKKSLFLVGGFLRQQMGSFLLKWGAIK